MYERNRDGKGMIVAETRLICPCCNMGVIQISDELENKLTFPTETRMLLLPRDYPRCNGCRTMFEISIDKSLKITIRKV